jgi:hypothetical protein
MAQHDEDPRDEDKDEAGATPEEEGGEAAEAEAKAEPTKEAPKKEAAKKAPKKEGAKKEGAKKEGAKKDDASVPVVARRPAPPPQAAGSLGKSAVLFVVVVGALAAGFALLGREPSGGGGPRSGPAWKNGQVVDMEITLVATDKRELACSAADEVAGRHCAFEAPSKPWSKGDNSDDKKILRPYTTVDGTQFIGAGLWSEPVLANSLPTTRFTVKCKYTVEGKVKAPTFHWESGWEGAPRGEMFAGLLSGCTLVQ